MGYSSKIYYGLSISIIILYVLLFLGFYESEESIRALEFYFRLFIGAMLVYMFNPFFSNKNAPLNKTERYIAFSGGTAILMMLGLNQIVDSLDITKFF